MWDFNSLFECSATGSLDSTIGIPRIPSGIYHKGRQEISLYVDWCVSSTYQFGRSAVLRRVQAQIRHKQVPPTGYPHLFRFDLELASAPRTRGNLSSTTLPPLVGLFTMFLGVTFSGRFDARFSGYAGNLVLVRPRARSGLAGNLGDRSWERGFRARLSHRSYRSVLMACAPLFTVVRCGLSHVPRGYAAISAFRSTAVAAEMPQTKSLHPIAQGLTTQLGNPKALLYWTALFPQFIDRTHPPFAQFLVFGIVTICVETAVLTGYAFAAASLRRAVSRQPFMQRLLKGVTGCFFILTGLLLGRRTANA